jgi:hypothetical protein
MKPLIALFGLLAATTGLSAQTTIYASNFDALPLGTNLTNQTWWGPNFNSGDIVFTRINEDGPGGVRAITRTQQVFAGRFYGGGIRDLVKDIPSLPGAIDPADVKISFWIKGTSSQSRGAVGFSLVSFDTTVTPQIETGAGYYKLISTPAEWTLIEFTLADMAAGIPGHGTFGKPFNFSNSNRMQVYVWTRNVQEEGWPIQEDENHQWTFSLADIRVVLDAQSGGDPVWAGYPVVDGWVDSGDWMGHLYVGNAPWVYSHDFGRYVYLPEDAVTADGAWAHVLK